MLALADPADPDQGPRSARPGTERMCAVSRRVAPIGELIRFVVSPSDGVLADVKRRLPGRGLWVAADAQSVAEAVRRGIFAKGFRRKVEVSPDLVRDTGDALRRALIEALAMAAKAGDITSGFSKVEAALRAGDVAALVHASDGAADGIRKLGALARSSGMDPDNLPVLNALTSAELDLALGRSNVIHAALRAGAASKTVLTRHKDVVRFWAAADDPAKAAASSLASTTSGGGNARHDMLLDPGVPADE